jgi:two-component system KDP operon response regulator KdpE
MKRLHQGAFVDKKVLIIGDDKKTQALLLRAFSQTGSRASAISNGGSAVFQFFFTQPDLIILDVLLSEPDRWQTLQQIRELSTVPIIVLTVVDDYKIRIEGLDRGADYVMAKPIDVRELQARVAALFRRVQKTAQGCSTPRRTLTYAAIDPIWPGDSWRETCSH